MFSLGINVSSPSTSSVFVKDLSIHNINIDNISDTDVYGSASVVTNIKSTVTSDSFKTVQGIFNLYFKDKVNLNCLNNKLLFRII